MKRNDWDMLTLILVLAPLFFMLYIGGLIAERHDKKEILAVAKQTEDSENKRNKPYLNCTRKGA